MGSSSMGAADECAHQRTRLHRLQVDALHSSRTPSPAYPPLPSQSWRAPNWATERKGRRPKLGNRNKSRTPNWATEKGTEAQLGNRKKGTEAQLGNRKKGTEAQLGNRNKAPTPNWAAEKETEAQLGNRKKGTEAQLGARKKATEAQLGNRKPGPQAQLGNRKQGPQAQLGDRKQATEAQLEGGASWTRPPSWIMLLHGRDLVPPPVAAVWQTFPPFAITTEGRTSPRATETEAANYFHLHEDCI